MDASKNPTKTEWLDKKDRLFQLYLEKGFTTQKIKSILEQEGFSATVRQYKQRWKEWGYDVKNIRHAEYQSMSLVLQRRGRCQFRVPHWRGNRTKILTAEQVKKQINRKAKKTCRDLPSRTQHFQLDSGDKTVEDSAEEVLRQKQIQIEEVGCLERPYNQQPDVPRPSDEELSRWRSETHSRPSSSETSLTLDASGDMFPHLPPLACSQRATKPLAYQPGHFTRYGVDFHTSAHQLGYDMVQGHRCFVLSSCEDIQNNKVGHDEFGLVSGLASLSLESTCPPGVRETLRSVLGTETYTRLPLTLSQECKQATEWAAYYIMRCLSGFDTLDSPDHPDRLRARHLFDEMLKQSNRFLFPFTHWIVTVFASNNKSEQLQAFLRDCCNAIDSSDKKLERTYGVPFHFILAAHLRDQKSVDLLGCQLKQSNEVIKSVWDIESPNYVLCQIQLAWYLLEQKQWDDVLQMMTKVLPISERILGCSHTMTTTCLAVLTRANVEMGRHRQAISHLSDACNRLQTPPKPLQAYKYSLLYRLADLQMQMCDHRNAENNFRAVMNFRINHMGIGCPSTWRSIKALCDLLTRVGRLCEAQDLDTDMTAMYHENLVMEGIARYGKKPDWACQSCNRPNIFHAPSCNEIPR